MSACISDSEAPSKHTSEEPQFGRSQTSARPPVSASARAISGTPGSSLPNRPPGVTTQARVPASPNSS